MKKLGVFAAFVVLLSSCTVHRIDVQQGNVIDATMVKQLQVGMTQKQVRFVLGSPMLQDPFHAGRWDYLYTLQPGDQRKITERKQISLFFEKDTLVKIVGADLIKDEKAKR